MNQKFRRALPKRFWFRISWSSLNLQKKAWVLLRRSLSPRRARRAPSAQILLTSPCPWPRLPRTPPQLLFPHVRWHPFGSQLRTTAVRGEFSVWMGVAALGTWWWSELMNKQLGLWCLFICWETDHHLAFYKMLVHFPGAGMAQNVRLTPESGAARRQLQRPLLALGRWGRQCISQLRLLGQKQQTPTSHSSGGWRSELPTSAELVSSEAPLLGL